jgi:hypothetical protein
MSFDANPNHVAGSFMIAVTSTDNPVPSSGSSEQPTATEPGTASHAADASPDTRGSSSDTPERGT